MVPALVIFVVAYALISGVHPPGLRLDRTSAALVGAVAMVVARALSVGAVPRLLDPRHGWMALAMASTLAGNLTIFGSVANLIVLELAGRHGKVGFFQFLKYGLVVTTLTTAIGLAILILEARLGY